MTIQALVFLRQLKSVQRSELGTIWIDEDRKEMKTYVDDDVTTMQEQTTVNLAKKWNRVDSMTDYLQEKGLLERLKPGYFYLSHKGYHYWQEIISEFLFKSILIPAGVSILTTLVTLWIQGIFSIK